MSTWRRKAIEYFPDLKKEFEVPDATIYSVFMELLPAAITAHKENNKHLLENIYNYAEWCSTQKEQELWDAAGVVFYEHLVDYKESLEALPKWVKPNIYKQIRGLLELRLDEKQLRKLDDHYKQLKSK